MPESRKIFFDEGPAWLRRAIQIEQHVSINADEIARLLDLDHELETIGLHSPAADGTCRGCLPGDTMPWPCAQARRVFRQHRGEPGWRPRWDEHIEGTS